jgi:hypothetical protein
MSNSELAIVLSSGGQFYAVLGVHRECGIWLSLEKKPLPVPSEWHRPGDTFAAVMRGRDYWRVGASAPQHSNSTKSIAPDDELVKDYLDAAWWTPGLQEAWTAADGLTAAMDEARNQIDELSRMHVCETPSSKKKGASRG